MISIRAADKLKDRPDEERKVIFLDIDGVLQPTTAQERFNHDMDALKVELARRPEVSKFVILDDEDEVMKTSDRELQQLVFKLNRSPEYWLESRWRDGNVFESRKSGI